MRTSDLVEELERSGGRITLERDRLIVEYPTSKTAECMGLLEAIRENARDMALALRLTQRTAVEPRIGSASQYFNAAMAATAKIASLGWNAKRRRLLARAYAGAHRNLFEEFPNLIAQIWEDQVELREFQAVLDEWVEAHSAAVALCHDLEKC